MQECESTLSLSQRDCVNTKSERDTSAWLLILVAGILFFNILALVRWNYNKSITIETLLISILSSVAISIYLVGLFVIKAPHVYRKLGGHEVKVFLLAQGVEIEGIVSEKFNVQKQLHKFNHLSGNMLACGTCIKSRRMQFDVSPLSTMKDMLKVVDESDKVLMF